MDILKIALGCSVPVIVYGCVIGICIAFYHYAREWWKFATSRTKEEAIIHRRKCMRYFFVIAGLMLFVITLLINLDGFFPESVK